MAQQKRSAAYDNQVLAFLVDCCEEGEGLEEALGVAYLAYCKHWPKLRSNPCCWSQHPMAISTLKERLRVAGFEVSSTHGTWQEQPLVRVTGMRVRGAANLPTTQAPRGSAGGGNFVWIGGAYYRREMVATLRPIRPFFKDGESIPYTHVVTFLNPEVRPRFLQEAEARELQLKLG